MIDTKVYTVQVDDLSKLDIAGHNTIIKSRHELAGSEWERLLGQGKSTKRQAVINSVHGIRGTLRASSAFNGVCSFSWTDRDGDQVVVFCTKPSCSSKSFTDLPLQREEARMHFRKHGLELNDNTMQLFGFKGVSIYTWLADEILLTSTVQSLALLRNR